MPLWGDAPESVINDFQQKFKLSLSELEVLFGAYREDNPNSKFSHLGYFFKENFRMKYVSFATSCHNFSSAGIFVVRDDSFVEDLIAESELGCFEHLETIPVRCRGYISASLAKYPVSYERCVNYEEHLISL